MQRSTTRTRPNRGKRARMGHSFLYVAFSFFFSFIISSFMSGTPTNNYCIIRILDRTVRRRPRRIRDRQLQVVIARLGGEHRRPPRTNIPATRWHLQRDSRPERCFDFFLPRLWRATVIAASLCRLGKLALVSQPRHISFLCLTRNAPATLGSQIPWTDPTSGRDS